MKKRMWLWCLIAAFGLSFSVACSDDDEKEDVTPTPTPTQPVPPTQGDPQTPVEPTPSQSVIVVDTMDVAANIEEVPYTGGTITFTTTTNQDYTVASTADWITIDSDGRALTATYTVTATVAANEGEAREGKITVTFADEAKTVKEVVVKQAAYVAPEQTPQTPVVPEPGTGIVADLTIDFEYEAGAASGKLDGAEITAAAKTALGLEDLAGAQIMGFLADGTMAELQTTVAVEGGYACDGWMTAEGIMTSWGTEHAVCIKPWNTPESMDVFLASTEVGTTAVGYFAYVNGDAKYVVKVNVTVIEAPEVPEVPSDFVAPEADYTIDIQVVQDNGWGPTYFALDGTEMGYWGAYSDPDAYVNPIADVSVDITPEIEDALGITEGDLEASLEGGQVYVGAYNATNEFVDCYETVTSYNFFWFDAYGAVQGASNMACIDGFGYHDGTMQMYGTTCVQPNAAEIGTTYATYIVFKTDDAEYVVKVAQEAVEVPEAIVDETEYTVVAEYEVAFETSFAAGYGGGTHVMDAGTVSDMATLLELDDLANATYQMLNAAGEVVEDVNGLGGTNGWYGVDGPASWGNGSIVFFNKDGMSSIDSWAYGCHPEIALVGDVVVVKVQFRNADAAKAINYIATITVVD